MVTRITQTKHSIVYSVQPLVTKISLQQKPPKCLQKCGYKNKKAYTKGCIEDCHSKRKKREKKNSHCTNKKKPVKKTNMKTSTFMESGLSPCPVVEATKITVPSRGKQFCKKKVSHDIKLIF